MPKQDILDVLGQVHVYNIDFSSREIYLHSHFGADGEEPGVDYRMAVNFVKNLRLLDNDSDKPILVHMHTVGGEWCDGIAIFDAIRTARSKITILAYAQASSMSGVIFQAADRRVMMPNCEFLIHYGSVHLERDSVAAKSMVEWNEKLNRKMLGFFAQRAILCGSHFKDYRDIEEVEKFFDQKIRQAGDWFCNAQEAVTYGLADGIYGNTGNYKTLAKLKQFQSSS